MFTQTETEREASQRRAVQEELQLYKRIYKRGAGCFGVSRHASEVKKQIQQLQQKLSRP